MLGHVLRYSLPIILVLWIQQGSPTVTVLKRIQRLDDPKIRLAKSQEMRKYMNLSVDPCEDFYEYNCGNFAKYNPVSEEVPVKGLVEKTLEAMDSHIKSELQSDEPTANDADEMVKNFYRSCVKVPASIDFYKSQLKQIIWEFGKMPAMEGDQWQEDEFDWLNTVAQMIRKTGTSNIFEIAVMPDFTENSINRVYFGGANLIWGDRALYVDETFAEQREAYVYNTQANLENYLGVEAQLAEQTARELMDLEIKLARGMADMKLGLGMGEVFFLDNVSEVDRKYFPDWDFEAILSEVMGVALDELYVNRGYLTNAMDVLARTPKRVVANYVFFKYIYNFLYPPLSSESEIENYCTENTKGYFYRNVNNLIYRKYFTAQAEATLHGMWRELKTSFLNILLSPRLDWIRDETKQQAVEKLKSLKMKILSYEHIEDAAEFAQLDLNSYDYVANIKQILTLMGQQEIAKLNQPPQGLELGVVATTTLAYSPLENCMHVPVAYLLPEYLWSLSYPAAYNMANLGFYMAHEILHGFDNEGRHYDAKGNARDWWDAHTDQEFRDRSACFVDQYKRYMYGGHYLPEMASQAENIADNGGIRLAYEAYTNWYAKADNRRRSLEALPELNYSPEQLFFVSYGSMWCSDQHPSVLPQILADTHSPDKIRAVAPLVNFEVFAETFNCPRGSAMNPADKCMIY